MTKDPPDAEPSHVSDRRRTPREPKTGATWETAITSIAPNQILLRGYPLDEVMGRLSFAEAVYLLLRGEVPTHAIGKLFAAILVSSIDHGVTPPSTVAARSVASAGASLRDSVIAGISGFGIYHGGDVESCMRFLQQALADVHAGTPFPDAAARLVASCANLGRPCPGFGHRFHARDPRALRLFQLAHDLELDGEHVQMILELERSLAARPDATEHPKPINVDGAIAAVAADLGFPPELGNALFIIARVPGLVAHACEEQQRYEPLREVDPKDHVYDGPPERRLPETRK
jgi:citrate synthase